MTYPYETDEERQRREAAEAAAFWENVGEAAKKAAPYVVPVVGGLAFVGLLYLLAKD